MTIIQIKYFITIVENRTYLEASEILNISQSSLSKIILKLERELSVSLFDRSKRVVSLTEAGTLFYEDSQNIINEYKKAMLHLAKYKNSSPRTLHLSMLPILSQYGINNILQQFQKSHPNINLAIFEMEDKEIVAELNDETCDLAIIRVECLHDARYVTYPIATDELVLITSPTHRFAHKKAVSISELVAERFIFMNKHISIYELCIDVCTKNGFIPNVVRTCRMESILSAVSLDEGVSLLMRKNIDIFNHNSVSIVPLKENITSTVAIAALKKRNLKEIEKMLIKALTQC